VNARPLHPSSTEGNAFARAAWPGAPGRTVRRRGFGPMELGGCFGAVGCGEGVVSVLRALPDRPLLAERVETRCLRHRRVRNFFQARPHER
jgi:hypothetical protein